MIYQPSIYLWPEGHEAKDIEDFTISSGNFPIREYHFRSNEITGRNRINGSRDGWMTFPQGFFNGRTVMLKGDDVSTVWEILTSIDFQTWITERRVFDLIGSEGFCISEAFSCTFIDGKEFRYIGLRGKTPKEFNDLYRVLDQRCKGPSFVSDWDPDRKLYKVLCPLCAKPIRPNSNYCSECGKELTSHKYFVLTMLEIDLDETVRLCRYCGNDISFSDSYCRSCGALTHEQWDPLFSDADDLFEL